MATSLYAARCTPYSARMSKFSERYSIVASTLALGLAVSTGGAVAASALIDGKNIKSGTVKTKQLAKNAVTTNKVKDGSLTAADFKAGQLPAGAQGPAGPKGRDAGDPIPSGTTVTGTWRYDSTSTTSQSVNDSFEIALPGVAPAALSDASVNFASGGVAGDADPACTGSESAPTAPAGKVCIYITSSTNLTALNGYTSVPTYGRNRAFRISVLAPAANADIYGYGTWAYTAQ